MPPKMAAPKHLIYQLKITLMDINPLIWRRILVKDNIPLSTLAEILQTAMGWRGEHLHEFETETARYGIPDEEFPDDELLDESETTLRELSDSKGFMFGFYYDFGDGWCHRVEIEAIAEPKAGVKYPVCIKGARACPPDDCGGPGGYDELVEAMQNKKSKQRKELIEWLGGEFSPEKFDIDEVNAVLKRL